jgi:hypothetical protein
MKIAIGKIGKTIKFNSNTWGAVGGDNEAPLFFTRLIHRNPQDTFYIVGTSDFERCNEATQQAININGNVVNCWDGFAEWKKDKGDIAPEARRLAYLNEVIIPKYGKEITRGLFFVGLAGSSNVLGKTRKSKPPHDHAKPLNAFSSYAAPIIDFINQTKIRHNFILNDPRALRRGTMKDLFVKPTKIHTQFNYDIKHTRFTSYDDTTVLEEDYVCEYDNVEKIFLMDKERTTFPDKNINMMIVCNEGAPSRYEPLNDFILQHHDDIEIYGKWKADTIGDDPRFKGPLKFNKLQEKLPYVKYTFCIPILTGWATAKFWEMAHYGIIPFLHPDYDTQLHIKCPKYLRVKDADDLQRKIAELEAKPEKYRIIRDYLGTMIKDEYYDGSYLTDRIHTALK